MKRSQFWRSLIVVAVAAPSLLAQSNRNIGTWKLNVAKSKYGAGQAPKAEAATVVAQGDGAKYSFSGVNADGSPIAFSYTTSYDGKDSPVSGAGPFGQDTIARKRVDANTTTSTSKKAGKVIATMTTVISEDGKVMTVNSQGIGADGKPRNVVSVWDKQ